MSQRVLLLLSAERDIASNKNSVDRPRASRRIRANRSSDHLLVKSPVDISGSKMHIGDVQPYECRRQWIATGADETGWGIGLGRSRRLVPPCPALVRGV